MAEDVIREGKWRCPNCRRLNRGPAMKCDGCGQTRGDVPFIYDEGGAVVDDAAGVAEALAGPDWVCAYCATSSPHAQPACRQCGSRRDGADRQRKEVTAEQQAADRAALAAAPGAPGAPDLSALPPGPPPAAPAGPSTEPRPPTVRGCCGCVGCGAVFVFLMSMLLAMCGYLDVDMTVTGLSWERSITVEQRRMVAEEAWRDEVPADATVTGRRPDVRSHRSIPDGTEQVMRDVSTRVKVGSRRVKVGVEDLGNGRFRERYEDKPIYESRTKRKLVTETRYRQEPVYDERVTYQVPRWSVARTAAASGIQDQELRWPDAPLAADEREASRAERLLVQVRADDDPAPRTYEARSLEDWRRFAPGQRCRGGLGLHGRAVGLNPR